MTLTAIPGIRVGHWTDPVGLTGCTVVDLPEPNVVAVDTRGAAPGSRETALLAPGMKVEQVQAIMLTGGSAFGLAAADGVMTELAAAGRGHPTPVGPVPIVPAAVVFDLATGDPLARPGAAEGAAAWRAATADPVPEGRLGAGTGCTVAKWRGEAIPSGIGSVSVDRYGATVAALVVLNAVGDIFSLEGQSLSGGPLVPGPPAVPSPSRQNTTLVVVATDAQLDRNALSRVAVRAHDAMAVCIRPVHTMFDGDTCFAVSCGTRVADAGLVAEAAFESVGRAIARAVSITTVSDTL